KIADQDVLPWSVQSIDFFSGGANGPEERYLFQNRRAKMVTDRDDLISAQVASITSFGAR
ncbi:MAG: hypothetical protein E6Z15_20915, partial [Paenibacillus macerans]|nr:hypothetical protein [Paenibacillus macerans]